MSDAVRSILFAAATAVICSLLLTGAAMGLKKYKDRNVALDRQKNILRSVGLIESDKVYPEEKIEELYRRNIDCLFTGLDGRLQRGTTTDSSLPVCLYRGPAGVKAYVVPANMKGLWGEIQSYVAIENDGSTVKGFSVSSHSETPGLGGEIEKKWFQENFKDKRIVDGSGKFVSILVAKGKATAAVSGRSAENAVDGISGATLTGRFLTEGLEKNLKRYEPLSERFRNNTVSMPPEEAGKP